MKKLEKTGMVIAALIGLILSFYFDKSVAFGIEGWRTPWMSSVVMFLTDFGLLF